MDRRTASSELTIRAQLAGTSVHGRVRGMRALMERSGAHAEKLDRIARCTAANPCNSRLCTRCAVPPARGNAAVKWFQRRPGFPDPVDWTDPLDLGYPTMETLSKRPRARNFRVRGGQLISEPFVALAHDEVFAGTINLRVVSRDADLKEVARRERKRLRRAFRKHLPTARVSGRFSYALKLLGNVRDAFPPDELPSGSGEAQSAPGPVAMFHIHFLIHVPGHTASQIGDRLRSAGFPGARRVRIQPVTEPHVDHRGVSLQGPGGWGEYASMEKFAWDDELDPMEAGEADLALGGTWTRRDAQFEHGVDPATRGLSDRLGPSSGDPRGDLGGDRGLQPRRLVRPVRR